MSLRDSPSATSIGRSQASGTDPLIAGLERSHCRIVKQTRSAQTTHDEERDGLTQDALADIDAGRVIDHQTVQAWVQSLETDQPLPIPR